MPRPIKLSDLDLILLSAAYAREGGHLHPLKESIAGKAQEVEAAIAGLLRRRLLEKVATPDAASTWKSEGDERVGLVLTQKARALIDGQGEGAEHPDVGAAEPPTPPRPGSKIETVLALLGREEGASPAELIDATGWLPHTMRAALTGLRRKGHGIERGRRGELAVYRLASGA
nr:DUF3489 domain-containing protein [Sphingobium sp.]